MITFANCWLLLQFYFKSSMLVVSAGWFLLYLWKGKTFKWIKKVLRIWGFFSFKQQTVYKHIGFFSPLRQNVLKHLTSDDKLGYLNINYNLFLFYEPRKPNLFCKERSYSEKIFAFLFPWAGFLCRTNFTKW